MKMANSMRAALGTEVASRQAKVPSGRLWPNGEFSLGYTVQGQESDPGQEWKWTGGESGLTPNELDERLECLHSWLEAVDSTCQVSGQLALRLLTLSNVWNSHKPTTPTKNGLQGLTGYGTKMLRSACYLLEERLGKDDCVMITLTVPALGRDARRRLAEQWGVVTNRLVQYLSRALLSAGRAPVIAGCVEIQTGRLEKYRQGYLHLHLVCPAHSNTGGCWAIDASELRTWWKECIERYAQTSLPHLPRVETAIVEKSVEAYLGKYLSKGTGEELAGFVADLGESAVPGQWWFMSSPMRRAVKAETRSGINCGAVLDVMVNHLLEQGTGEGFDYIRHIDCEMSGRRITVGFVGKLSPELAAELRAMLKSR